jgi:hypothetical protein
MNFDEISEEDAINIIQDKSPIQYQKPKSARF